MVLLKFGFGLVLTEGVPKEDWVVLYSQGV